tara:strand:+ start:52 stop:420 length:369 start_codon:yes stop_codon:yes gene_type:complete
MNITQTKLRKMIAEAIEARLNEVEEAASWASPLIAMMAPMMGYYLYHWFAKQGEDTDRRLDEGMKMPDLPADLLAQIPDSPRDISAGLYAELMKHLPGLNTNDLRAINDMIANLVAAKKAQS